MKKISWEVAIDNERNKVGTIETVKGFDKNSLEDNYTIIGILDNLKQLHLDKLKTLLRKPINF